MKKLTDVMIPLLAMLLALGLMGMIFVFIFGGILVMIVGSLLFVPLFVSGALVVALWGEYGPRPRKTGFKGDEDVSCLQPWDEGQPLRDLPLFRKPRRLPKGRWPD